MMKTVLIPTDLQVGSLNALKSCLAMQGKERVRVILLHAVHPPEGITDLLFYSPRRMMNQQIGPAFKEALAVLRNHFEQRIQSLEIIPFHGITQTAFDQFLKSNEVNEIHIPLNYELHRHARAIDPLPMIRKSKVRVQPHGSSMPVGTSPVHQDDLQLLFER